MTMSEDGVKRSKRCVQKMPTEYVWYALRMRRGRWIFVSGQARNRDHQALERQPGVTLSSLPSRGLRVRVLGRCPAVGW